MKSPNVVNAILAVGGGRGFVVQDKRELRYVITAAHCPPKQPPAHPWSYIHERTYAKLLGSIKKKRRPVWAECVFADPVADIAVLGPPDSQELSEESRGLRRFDGRSRIVADRGIAGTERPRPESDGACGGLSRVPRQDRGDGRRLCRIT